MNSPNNAVESRPRNPFPEAERLKERLGLALQYFEPILLKGAAEVETPVGMFVYARGSNGWTFKLAQRDGSTHEYPNFSTVQIVVLAKHLDLLWIAACAASMDRQREVRDAHAAIDEFIQLRNASPRKDGGRL